MTLLSIIFFVIALLGLFLTNQKKGDDIFAGITIVLLIFLRTFVDLYSVPDLLGYQSGFNELVSVAFSKVPTAHLYTLKTPEVGFRYIMKLTSYVTTDFRLCLFVVAILTLLPYYKTIKKYSTSSVISICLVYLTVYTQSIFVLRQHLAMAIILLSYKPIIERDFKQFVIIVLIAFLMHQSALVFLPVYFIYGAFINNNKRFVLLLLVSMVVLSALFTGLFSFFAENLSGYEQHLESANSSIVSLAISGTVLFVYIIFCREKIFDKGIHRLLFILLVFDFMLLLSGWQLSGMPRLLMYFSNCVFLAIPIVANSINNKMIKTLFYVSTIAIYYYMTFSASGSEFISGFSVSF